jgi:WD40 repeat protein
LSPDGKLAALAVAGNLVELYDTTTGKAVRYLQSWSTPDRVAFSPDGNQLAVGERSGLVTLWHLPLLELPADQRAAPPAPVQTPARQPLAHNLKGHQAAIEALAFTADGRKLISIDRGGTARCWDKGDLEESRVLEQGLGQIDDLSYSPDGRYLARASMHGGIRVHDLTSADRPRSLTTRCSRRVVFSPDGRTIAGGPDHRVTLWDAKTGGVQGTFGDPEPAEIGAMAFSPGGHWLAVGVGGAYNFTVDAPQKVMVYDVAHCNEHRTFATPTQVSAVAFSADGKLMAAAGHNGTVWLWDTSSWDEIARWQGPANARYSSILFVPSGRPGEAGQQLVTGSTSGRIDLWDVRTRALTRQMHRHISPVSVMALSPDGRTLATASWDGSIKLWDSGTGRELRTLSRESKWMYSLAFSPDGNTLASGGLCTVLRLWEASSTERVTADLAELELHAKTSRSQGH